MGSLVGYLETEKIEEAKRKAHVKKQETFNKLVTSGKAIHEAEMLTFKPEKLPKISLNGNKEVGKLTEIRFFVNQEALAKLKSNFKLIPQADFLLVKGSEINKFIDKLLT